MKPVAESHVLAQFDWSSLKPEEQSWLRDRTAAIKLGMRQTTTSLLLIGAQLAMVRERLGAKKWRAWLGAHFALDRRTARRLMLIARQFSGVEQAVLDRIDRSALYVLCEPSVPSEARAYAIQLVSDGQPLTHSEAREIVEAHRPMRDVPLKELKGRAAKEELIVRTELINVIQSALESLLSSGGSLYLSTTVDSDHGMPVVYARYTPEEGPSRQVTRSTVAAAVLAVSQREPEACCKACGKVKPTSHFGPDAGHPTGLSRNCRACEKIRHANLRRAPAVQE